MDASIDPRPAALPGSAANRLSLAQLVLWMSVTCAVLANEHGLRSTVETHDRSVRLFLDIHMLCWSPLHGASIAGLLIWLRRRLFRGDSPGTTPGHWVLVALAVKYLVVQVREWFHVALGFELLVTLPLWSVIVERALGWLIDFAIAAVATAYCWNQRWWRASFVTMALRPVNWAAYTLLFWAFGQEAWFPDHWVWQACSYLLFSLAALFAIAGLVSDRRSSVPRDFLHYGGAAVLILQAALVWPGWIVWEFVLR